MKLLNYSIITAARNEEKYIFKTLESVIAQSILPQEWIIINDGSTDGTSNIIERYTQKYSWIKKIDLSDFKPELKSTGGRVGHILNIAASRLATESNIITKLDADTEFDSFFFERLLNEFQKDMLLGIASGNLVFEGEIEKIENDNNVVRGAVMMIRQEVFKQINGFFESKGNGEDTLFGVAARYYGWITKTFPVYFNHLKPEGIKNNVFYMSYLTGFYKGSIPYRFDYFLFTQFKHVLKKPYIFGSIIQIFGYLKSRFLERYKPFPQIVTNQIHKEQVSFLKNKLKI